MRILRIDKEIAQCVVLFLLFSAGVARPTTVHVPEDRPSIQAGIHLASDGDTVLVAPGTYDGEGNRNIRFLGKAIVLLSENGAAATSVDCQGLGTGFLLDAGEDSLAIIDGFTVINGASSIGGSMLIRDGSYPVIANCRFVDSHAFNGGAVACLYDAGPTFRYCDFIDCQAEQHGGALYVSDAAASARDCTFEDNSAGLRGGAIFAYQNTWGLTLVHCTFVGNSAGRHGGAICSDYFGASVSATRCSFHGNSSQYLGGALSVHDGFADMTDCMFSGNYAAAKGGAVDSGLYGSLVRCTFANNTAGQVGGALVLSSSAEALECTVVGNGAPQGGGVASQWGARIENSIIAFSTEGGAFHVDAGGVPPLRCCDLYGNAGGDWVGPIENQLGVNGNITADPLFCGSQNPNEPWTMHADSPCLPGASPDCGLIGAWGEGCSSTDAASTSWTRVKARFR